MDLFFISLLAVGLSMDCFTVSVGKGICVRTFRWRYALRMAVFFGLFQGLMLLTGFFISRLFAKQIAVVDHWVAFILLSFIGGKMIFEACRKGESPEGGNCCEESSFSAQYAWREVIPLAIATSIDALAAGVVFSPFPQWIIPAVLIVGATSFLFSLAGTEVGAFFGRRFRWKVDILGGIILVFIGVKILLEHLLSGNT